jgi:hypothetical protein
LEWRDGLVRRLARSAYDERLLPSGHLDPHRLAVLADAAEEAGADAELLGHLREPGAKVRGDWVIDLLLGLAFYFWGSRERGVRFPSRFREHEEVGRVGNERAMPSFSRRRTEQNEVFSSPVDTVMSKECSMSR